MTINPREIIDERLLDIVRNCADFRYAGRRGLHIDQFPQPAVFLITPETGENHSRKTNMEPVVFLYREIWIYAKARDEKSAISSVMNPLLDAVTDILSIPDGAEENTLGGVVSSARISGEVRIAEDHDTGQGSAIIPVEILATF